MKVKSLSRVQLLETPWTAAHQATPSMGFSRQEYWSGVPLPSLACHEAKPKKKKKTERERRGLKGTVVRSEAEEQVKRGQLKQTSGRVQSAIKGQTFYIKGWVFCITDWSSSRWLRAGEGKCL